MYNEQENHVLILNKEPKLHSDDADERAQCVYKVYI